MTNDVAYLISRKHKTSHVLHLILTVLSFFAGAMVLMPLPWWLPVWLLVGVSNAMHNYTIDRQIKRAMRPDTPDAPAQTQRTDPWVS